MADKLTPWYAIARGIVNVVCYRALGGLTAIGVENIPEEGPVIFAPNHLSHLDPPMVACGQKRRQLCFMSKEEMFKIPVLGSLIRSLGAFPIRRGESDAESIRRSISLLNEGRTLLIFPEGTRGYGKELQPFNRGVSMLAKHTGAKIVPVAIIGTNLILPKGKKMPLRRHKMKIVYGDPFTYADTAQGKNEKENRRAFTAELSQRIIELCQQHGYDLKISTELALQAQASSQ